MVKYNKKYYSRGDRNIVLEWVVNVLTIINLEFFKKNFEEKNLILEVGCGDGKISRYLSENGFKVDALDVSSDAINIAKSQKSKVSYFLGDIFRLKAKNNYYEAVYSLHVMEHVKDYKITLKEIYRILIDGGKLVIRIPNSDSWEARIAGNKWFHYDEPYHVNHWTDREFCNILLKTGFKNIKINYGLLEYKQILLYSLLNHLGIATDSLRSRLLVVPLQILFVPLSILLGLIFKNSGTIEIVAVKP